MAKLKLQNLSKNFGEIIACEQVSLEIEQGELFYLLGPSGCGKSTLLNIIAGHLVPDSGEVVLDGRDITQNSANKRPIHTIFQNYALFPHMTVEENITFSLRMKGESTRSIELKVSEMIELIGLEDFRKRFPTDLSGGQQQRVAIARAVINKPSILLLDEPFGALDVKLKWQMQAELRKLQRELKMTFVCVSHDQEEALSTADRVAVMKRGRIEQVGTPEAVYCSPCSRFVAEFIGDSNIFEGTVEEQGDSFSIIKSDSGLSLEVAKEILLGKKVEVLLRPERIKVTKNISEVVGDSSLVGKVANVVFSGPTATLEVSCDSGCSLRVEIPIIARGEHPIAGESLKLYWNREDLTLLNL